MNFLRKLSQDFFNIFQKRSSSFVTPEPFPTVTDDELISRFLFSSSNFSKQKATVKYGAFMPAGDGNASVIRIMQLSESEIQVIDDQVVSAGRGIPSKGRADFVAKDAFNQNLKIEIDTSPHPRHANLTHYASDESARRAQAQKLAECTKLTLKS